MTATEIEGPDATGVQLERYSRKMSYAKSDSSVDESIEDESDQINMNHKMTIKKWAKQPEPFNITAFESKWLLKGNEYDHNLIHCIMEHIKQKQKRGNDIPSTAADFVEALVVQKPDLFVTKDINKTTPLIDVAQHQVSILFRILALLIPQDVQAAIQSGCEQDQDACPLELVVPVLRNHCAKRKPAMANGEMSQQGTNRKTCLHHTVDTKTLAEKNEHLKKQLSIIFSNKSLLLECLKALLVESKFDPVQNEAGQEVIQIAGFQTLLGLCPDGVFSHPFESGYVPLHAAIKLYGSEDLDYQLLLDVINESDTLDRRYIGTMKDWSGMDFETVLDYVKLPYWKPQDRKKKTSELGSQARAVNRPPHHHAAEEDFDDEPPEPNPYEAVFDWLWEGGVSKIFTVEVDDDGPEPHTNATLRRAFRCDRLGPADHGGFEVEVWNWKKFDICAETVAEAAPSARQIHLYSHGNIAVLRGWATSPGLASLMKLKSIFVHVYPTNVDDKLDCEEYKALFKATLAKNCPQLAVQNINMTVHPLRGSANEQADIQENAIQKGLVPYIEEKPNTNEWIDNMKNFRSFVRNLPLGKDQKPVIKVALLDDGVKLTMLDGMLEGMQQGRSFRGDKEEYFVGPCSHGTTMARCIREVYPMAKLYIARLDDSRHVENQRFTLASCFEALQWALDMGVDVISMSWTFGSRGGEDDKFERRFIELIRNSNSKVVFFGSLPDKGSSAQLHQFLPMALNNVIKIGAATIHGEGPPENLQVDPDFLLPGENLPGFDGEVVRGSSYATAYASGLAAIVLYCIRAHCVFEDDADDAVKACEKAATPAGMRAIFRRLCQRSIDKVKDGAFVMPYVWFGHSFPTSQEDKKKALSHIVADILPREVLQVY